MQATTTSPTVFDTTSKIVELPSNAPFEEDSIESRLPKTPIIPLMERVNKAAIMLFEIVVNISLFLISPTMYCTGTLGSIFAEKRANQLLDRAATVWTAQNWSARTLFCIGAFIALPYSLSASALFVGMNTGRHLNNNIPE